MLTILTVCVLLCSFANGQVRFDARLGNNQNLSAGDTVRFNVINNIAGLHNQGGGVLRVNVSGQYYLGVSFRCKTRLTLTIFVNAVPAARGYCQRGAGSIMLVRELKNLDTLRVKRRIIGAAGISEIKIPSRFVGFMI